MWPAVWQAAFFTFTSRESRIGCGCTLPTCSSLQRQDLVGCFAAEHRMLISSSIFLGCCHVICCSVHAGRCAVFGGACFDSVCVCVCVWWYWREHCLTALGSLLPSHGIIYPRGVSALLCSQLPGTTAKSLNLNPQNPISSFRSSVHLKTVQRPRWAWRAHSDSLHTDGAAQPNASMGTYRVSASFSHTKSQHREQRPRLKSIRPACTETLGLLELRMSQCC